MQVPFTRRQKPALYAALPDRQDTRRLKPALYIQMKTVLRANDQERALSLEPS